MHFLDGTWLPDDPSPRALCVTQPGPNGRVPA